MRISGVEVPEEDKVVLLALTLTLTPSYMHTGAGGGQDGGDAGGEV